MTKKELEKEAEVFVSEKADKGNFDVEKFGRAYFSESSMKQALVKFAEPREKRIAELEAQIEEMKCCGSCKFGCIACGNYLCELELNNCNSIPFHCDKWEIKENDR